MDTFNQQGQTVHGSQQNAETITNTGQTFSIETIIAPADLPAFLPQLQAALT